MKEFAALLHSLILCQSRNRKIAILTEYLKNTQDPQRGYALAILTGNLSFSIIKSTQLKELILQRIDKVLFEFSYDYVGDLGETIAYLWSAQSGKNIPSLQEVVETLQKSNRQDSMSSIVDWLNRSTDIERWALIKLITGGLRIGLSERLAKIALSRLSTHITLEDIEEIWHGLIPPYTSLFSWLLDYGDKPTPAHTLNFRSLMLSTPITEEELTKVVPEDFSIEWKWDGIRVQVVGNGKECRLYSRSGEDISSAFPDITENVQLDGVVDGELLIKRRDAISSFNDLQQRLNRKKTTKQIQSDYPAFVILYDLLINRNEDLRPLPFKERRLQLEKWFQIHLADRWDLSPLVPFKVIKDLKDLHSGLRIPSEYKHIEGFMIKRLSSPYLAGRVKGHWYKWKRDPLSADVVMMYAQRGHGKRSSYYSDYTLGAWTTDEKGNTVLVPVAKAYSGFSDKELIMLDRWVRNNTTKKFGPVREVKQELVLEIEFDSVQASNRHKSKVAVRFPRISRLRWDKSAVEADTVENLKNLI